MTQTGAHDLITDPDCDYCDGVAVIRYVPLDLDGALDESWACARHARRIDPEMITARWTGTYWQAVR